MLRAVVFDFDGVMIDTEWSAFTIWRRVFESHGADLTLDDFVRSIGTRGAIDFSALLTAKTGMPAPTNRELRAWKQPLQDEAVAELPLMPGVLDWLETAAAFGVERAIASSSERTWIEPHLQRHAIAHHFSHVSTWDGPHVGFPPKPAPDLYVHAVAALGVEPHEALAIEDSLNGARAAVAAGLRVLAVPTRLTAGLDFSIADIVVGSLGEIDLTDALETLRNLAHVRAADYDDTDALELVVAQQRELAQRWDDDPPCSPGGSATEYRAPHGGFRVIELEGVAVGCGGMRRVDEQTAELKRMYVAPSQRGRGLGRKLLNHLEVVARAVGYERLILETGNRLHEAMRLYETNGWTRIANYGEYTDSPDSRCYEKWLP